MATYLAKGATNTYFTVGSYYTPGDPLDTYHSTRAYMRFDLSGTGLSLGDITSVKLYVYPHYQQAGGVDISTLKSAISTDSNWGTTVDATEADWLSTAAHIEDTGVDLSTNGAYVSYTIDKNNIDLSGTLWLKILDEREGTTYTTSPRYTGIYSQDSASNKPYVEIITSDGTVYTFAGVCTN